MNLKELAKIKKIIVLGNTNNLKEFPHIKTQSHPLTQLDIARGLANEGITPIIYTDTINIPNIHEKIIIITSEKINPHPTIQHIEPANETETEETIISAALNSEPVIITPHNTGKKQKEFTIGRLETLQTGEKCTIIADTSSITQAIKDTQKLAEQGTQCTLLHCHTLNPIDKHTLISCALTTKNIVCTERIAAQITKIIHEHAPTPITIAHNNEFIHAVRKSVKKIN